MTVRLSKQTPPYVKLPLPEPNEPRQDVACVDPDPHVDLHLMGYPHLSDHTDHLQAHVYTVQSMLCILQGLSISILARGEPSNAVVAVSKDLYPEAVVPLGN